MDSQWTIGAKNEPEEEDALISEKGVDYTRLRDLLKAQKFEDADYETHARMLESVGRKDIDYLRKEEALHFPYADLKTIDRLWLKYSNGRFGFSVQKEIYVQCGAKLDGKYPGEKIWCEFIDRVGWRISSFYWLFYSERTFKIEAPAGHLPSYFCEGTFGYEMLWSLLSHRDLQA